MGECKQERKIKMRGLIRKIKLGASRVPQGKKKLQEQFEEIGWKRRLGIQVDGSSRFLRAGHTRAAIIVTPGETEIRIKKHF